MLKNQIKFITISIIYKLYNGKLQINNYQCNYPNIFHVVKNAPLLCLFVF